MTVPRFTIVVPTHERPDSLRRCVAALGQLDYPPEACEVLVVQDGPHPPLDAGLAELAMPFSFRFLTQEWGGPGKARNTGARAARGRFVAFLDDDCLADSPWLKELDGNLQRNPDGLHGGRIVNELPDNPFASASQLLVDMIYATYNRDPDNSWFFTSNNMAISASLFHQSGGFFEKYCTLSEDREFCNRLRSQGHRLHYAPRAVVRHAHALNLTSYCRQHFRYGRGAGFFHQARKSSTLWQEAAIHRNLGQWWQAPAERGRSTRERLLLFGLLILSQAAYACGAASFLLHPAKTRSWKD